MAKVILDTDTGEMFQYDEVVDVSSTINKINGLINRLNNFGVARQPSYDDLRMALYRSLLGDDVL